MATPQLVAQSTRTVSEADIRALALAKVRACNYFRALLQGSTEGFTDDQLVDLELELAVARKEMNAAALAFDRAV